MENEKPEPTLEQRVTALEAENKELRKLMAGLFRSLSEGLEEQKGAVPPLMAAAFAVCQQLSKDSPAGQAMEFFLAQAEAIQGGLDVSDTSHRTSQRNFEALSEMLRIDPTENPELPTGYKPRPAAG